MSDVLSPLAGTAASLAQKLDVPALVAAYTELRPNPQVAAQRVRFGTSGHRGTSLKRSFNEWHVAAITQAICDYRAQQGIDGPLYMGIDTHALSLPALETALGVLAANQVSTRIAPPGQFTPTPAVSRAILLFNKGRSQGLADGIVMTPSHNPPASGGYKYNPPTGGPADTDVTGWIQARSNLLLEDGLREVKRVSLEVAERAPTTHQYDFQDAYIGGLGGVINFDLIRKAGLRIGVDPLGGAGTRYWAEIGRRYGIDLRVVSEVIDPTFSFMTLDWDGQIRMDPSSPWAMQRLIGRRGDFDISFACDTDHDRHGIVSPSVGLLPANHYLCVAVDYLLRQRPAWSTTASVGKTVVTSELMDRICKRLDRRLFEVPVGFKWFAEGLLNGTLVFGGEESAGATFAALDGSVWTTDKDGIVAGLLAAEITASAGGDPGQYYQALTRDLGDPQASRIDAPASAAERAGLAALVPASVPTKELAGELITSVLTRAPGNAAKIEGIKVCSAGGWFAARPSGTEDLYKIYAESWQGMEHLSLILAEAERIVHAALAGNKES
jgi:phosphoglucomutase